MTTREEALAYGLSFDNVYEEKPFHDPNWQLVRVRGSKKAFLWIYKRNGFINLNVKVAPEWRDFWRSAYDSVIAGYHQNKEHWNTIILDGTIPEKEIRRMIAESYDLSQTVRPNESTKRLSRFRKVMWQPMVRLQPWQVNRRWQELWEMPFTRTRIRNTVPVSVSSTPKENSPEHSLLAVSMYRLSFWKKMGWKWLTGRLIWINMEYRSILEYHIKVYIKKEYMK